MYKIRVHYFGCEMLLELCLQVCATVKLATRQSWDHNIGDVKMKPVIIEHFHLKKDNMEK